MAKEILNRDYDPSKDYPPVEISKLKPGDCLFLHGEEWSSNGVEHITKSPWSHNTMVVKDPGTGAFYVAEMVWPQLTITNFPAWFEANPDVWVCRLKNELSASQERTLWNWWVTHLGAWYDVEQLIQLAFINWLQRILIFFGVPKSRLNIKPITVTGVCVTCCAWAWGAVDLKVDGTPTLMAPADVPRQIFLGPLEKVQISV